MPAYTVESSYHLPNYRHHTYIADDPMAACLAALDDDDWDGGQADYESAGETYVSGLWLGEDAAYRGEALLIPAQFDETANRKAGYFGNLVAILETVTAELRSAAGKISPDGAVGAVLDQAAMAIAKGRAILSGAADPGQ
jgi:hypothetical protein